MERKYQVEEHVVADLQEKAKEIRKRTLFSLYKSQSGHPGPSLSWADICTVLYFYEMNTEGEARDRFILSKGHGVATQYAALSVKFPEMLPYESLASLRNMGSSLQGHPVRGTLPYIDASTGSLGQGLSIAVGYALAFKRNKQNFRRVYTVLGDGEMQEGQVWEALMSGSKFSLENLVAIVDHNKYQNESLVKDTMPLEPFCDKLKSFGWNVYRIDGHNFEDLILGLDAAKIQRKPTIIVADTIKGKGISFMEGDMKWHSKKITDEDYVQIMEELK